MSLDAALSQFIDRVDPLTFDYLPVEKRPPEPGWKQLRRIADALAPKLRVQFLRAISAAVGVTSQDVIEMHLDRRDYAAVVKELDAAWMDAGRAVMTTDFLRPFMASLDKAGLVSVKLVGAKKPFSFEVENPRALEWAHKHAATLVVEIGNETRKGIRAQVSRMIDQGMSARETAKAIRGVQGFGLTERQAVAVENYRAGLLRGDLKPGRIDRMVSTYYGQLLDYRAMNIARTESMLAANAGYQETILQAVDEGLLDPNTTIRVWVTAGQDGAICDDCLAMEGAEAPISQPFSNGADMPPLHPQCRCVVVTEQRQ